MLVCYSCYNDSKYIESYVLIYICELQSLALKIKLPWVCTCMYLSGQQLVKPQNDLSANLSDWKAEVQLGLSV